MFPIYLVTLNVSNISICPVIHPHMIGGYLSVCNVIENPNIMGQYGLVLFKYWVTQSGYFRLATTVVLGVGIIYKKLLFCHEISEQNMDKTISTR